MLFFVYTSGVLNHQGVVGHREIYDAILKGIQESKSVELTVASFQLLHDLDLVNFLHQSCPRLQPFILSHVVPICPQSSGPLSSCLGFSSLPRSNVCISNYKFVVTVQLCLMLKVFVVAGFLFNHSLAILTLQIKLCANCFLTTASSTSNSKDSQREVRQRSGIWVHCNQGTISFFLGCLKFLHTWR
jgi:hypothetical protein